MADRDIWTLNKRCKAGDITRILFHKVEVLSVVEELPHYNRCRVKVHGPVAGSAGQINGVDIPIPPLLWGDGLYDINSKDNYAQVKRDWLAMSQVHK